MLNSNCLDSNSRKTRNCSGLYIYHSQIPIHPSLRQDYIEQEFSLNWRNRDLAICRKLISPLHELKLWLKKEVIIIFQQIKFIKTIQSDNLYCQVMFNTYYEIKPLKYLVQGNIFKLQS